MNFPLTLGALVTFFLLPDFFCSFCGLLIFGLGKMQRCFLAGSLCECDGEPRMQLPFVVRCGRCRERAPSSVPRPFLHRSLSVRPPVHIRFNRYFPGLHTVCPFRLRLSPLVLHSSSGCDVKMASGITVVVRFSTVHSVPHPFDVRFLLLYVSGTLPETTFNVFCANG
jgi:hypothetical protein